MVEHRPLLMWICHAILLLGGAIVCIPLYFAFVAGSLPVEALGQVPFPLLPGDRFAENAAIAWEKGNFSRVFLNSLIVTIGIVAGKIAISIIAAFAITYFRFRFRMTAFWLVFISLMLPVEVRIIPTYEAVADVAGPLRALIDALGLRALAEGVTGEKLEVTLNWNLINTYQGLILPLIASASATFLFRQFFLTVPDDLCEAARLDCAGPWKFFRTVLLPLSKSNIAALSIILFIYGWNQYLWPLLFTTDRNMGTAILALQGLVPVSDARPAWNIAMAAGFFVMLPPALVILIMQGWFAKGLVDAGK